MGVLRHRKWHGLLDCGIGGAAAGTAHGHVALSVAQVDSDSELTLLPALDGSHG